MVSTPLDMKYIYKRERCLERRKALSESSVMPDLSVISSPILYKNKVDNFITNCTNFNEALNLLEILYNDDRFDLLELCTQVVINDIIPMIEQYNLDNYLSRIEESSIGDINKDRLLETVRTYKSIDRIRKNHRNLSKRFKINENFLKNYDDKNKCYTICKMVDTYTLSPFIKFNIALEELAYLSFTEGYKIPDDIKVKYVTEYFLLRKSNSENDIGSYRSAIRSSKVISEGSDKYIQYLMNNTNSNSSYWKDKLNEWKLSPSKDIQSIVNIIRENYSDITALTETVDTLNEYLDFNELTFNTIDIFENIQEDGVSGEEAYNIINIIKENNINDPDELTYSLKGIWESELNDNIYYDGTESPETFTSDQIDKFKMHNLITDAQDAGEFLDQMEKTSMKEAPINVKKILSNDVKLDESNLFEQIDASGFITNKLRSYKYNGSVEEAYELVDSTVKCLNNILYDRDSVAYYTLGENYFDIGVRSKYNIILSEAQESLRGFSKDNKIDICKINEYTNILENMMNAPIDFIIEKLQDRNYAATVSVDEVSLIYEILNPYIDRDNNFMDDFIELCREEANPKYDRIKKECSSIPVEEFNIFDDNKQRLLFCADVMGIREDVVSKAVGNVKKAVNDTKNIVNKKSSAIEDKTSKSINAEKDNVEDSNIEEPKTNKTMNQADTSDNGKESISLNDVKLAWKGAKSKMKGASAKEQEISRDMDLEFNNLCKNIQSTFTKDYRTEIITGEVNRSLSKTIKMALALLAAGGASSVAFGVAPMVIPVLGAVALFAKSKHTSTKEKKMILDEIDIELQVIEREIQRAEQSGSTKKYRQLLTIQRNMLRKRQEIQWSMIKKGKKVPMPATNGMRSREY